MKKLKARTMSGQSGFIPMIICLILIIVGVLYVTYHYVAHAQH